MTCKIAGCKGDVYRARLCLACYDHWRLTGTLPKRASERPDVEQAIDPVAALEIMLETERHKATSARQRAQDVKEQRDRLHVECVELRARVRAQIGFARQADELAAIASALPEVVKTRELRQALSNYRKARAALDAREG